MYNIFLLKHGPHSLKYMTRDASGPTYHGKELEFQTKKQKELQKRRREYNKLLQI